MLHGNVTSATDAMACKVCNDLLYSHSLNHYSIHAYRHPPLGYRMLKCLLSSYLLLLCYTVFGYRLLLSCNDILYSQHH